MTRVTDLHQRGPAYGVPSSSVDGNDVLAVYEKMQEAVDLCRKGQGPVLIEAKTYRQGGHHVNDPGLYMPKERLEYYKTRDPVGIGRQYLLEQGHRSEEAVGSIEREIDRQMEEAIAFAANSPHPSVERFLEEVQRS